jgi:hypothetical protein
MMCISCLNSSCVTTGNSQWGYATYTFMSAILLVFCLMAVLSAVSLLRKLARRCCAVMSVVHAAMGLMSDGCAVGNSAALA